MSVYTHTKANADGFRWELAADYRGGTTAIFAVPQKRFNWEGRNTGVLRTGYRNAGPRYNFETVAERDRFVASFAPQTCAKAA